MEIETKPEVVTDKPVGMLRHIVELDAQGNPTDKCLCGHIWDRVFLRHDPSVGICQECVDELKRRGLG